MLCCCDEHSSDGSMMKDAYIFSTTVYSIYLTLRWFFTLLICLISGYCMPELYESSKKKKKTKLKAGEAAVFQVFFVGVPHKNLKHECGNSVLAHTCITTQQQCNFDNLGKKTIKRTKCSLKQSPCKFQP